MGPLLSKELVEIAICPRCHGKLAEAAQGEAMTCDSCGARYPVRGGIPVLVPEEAEKQ